MSATISEACWWDHCVTCANGACGCPCHTDEEFDPVLGEWMGPEDDD